jgi:acyl-CoA thioesterase YciA
MIKSARRNGGGRRLEVEKRPAGNGKSASPRLPLRFKSHDLQPAIRVVMMPSDANYLGTIFGGVILNSIDLAGAVEAQQHTDRKLVTVAMREVNFIAPVFVGDLVSFYTETVKLGRTSLTVRVTVEAKRAKASHETVRVTQAEAVYVAIDEAGKPVPVRG